MHDFTARQLILGKPLCRQGERFIRDILAGIQSNETQTLDSYTWKFLPLVIVSFNK